MRRNVARIGLIAALALSMGVATATAPPARADDHTGLIAPARASAGLMNYAINLSPQASAEDLARATSLVASARGVTLASYPELGTFFAQSESVSFAPDLAEALAKAGISVHSVGPTRVAAVPEGERQAAPEPQPAPHPGEASPAQPGAQSGGESGSQSGGPSSMRGRSATEADKPEDVANWGAQAMSAADAAAVPIAHAPVTVGVIDTGIDDTHPDLVGRVDTSRSVSCGHNGIPSQAYGSWRDDYFHGTHVAGIIAANHNGIGIDGIAPTATLVSIKASNEAQLMYPEYVTCGFMWAVSRGVDIVNNSYSMDPWVYWSPSDPEQAAGLEAATRAIAYARGKGLAVIASAGNDGMDNDNVTTDSGSPTDLDTPIKDRPVSGGVKVPAMVEGVSQVSAATRTNPETKPEWANLKRADFSNYGTSIDFTAPGQDIYSTVPTSLYASGYAKTSGTSMATPHITGIAALIKATHPNFRGKQITDLMRKQAAMEYTRLEAPEDGKEYRGYGFINALTTMRRDQMQPTVTTLEYRVGKGEWKSLDGATLPAGPVTFYAAAASPISHLHMDVTSLTGVDNITV
ncbi:MAG: peptidase S8, partial [Actinomyces sp.]